MVGAVRAAASIIGVVSGLLGAFHGYNEILQGSTVPSGILINAVGPPCQGNGCYPAMTIVPNFLYSGVLAVIVSLVILLWAAGFVQRKNGGLILIVLSVVQLLVGGGFLPPLLGIVAGAVGTRIKK
jgi:prolipoprotein diacylglyceryltransferase